MRRLARSIVRNSSFRLKIFQDTEKLAIEKHLTNSELTSVSRENLFTKSGRSIDMLTLPHNEMPNQIEALRELSDKYESSVFLFDFDPSKYVRVIRKIDSIHAENSNVNQGQFDSTCNTLHFRDIREPYCPFSNLSAILSKRFRERDYQLTKLASDIADILLMKQDKDFSNSNVFFLWISNIISRGMKEGRNEMAFAGMPQALLHASLNRFTEKGDLILSFVEWGKKISKKIQSGELRTISGIYGIPEISRLQLYTETRYLRNHFMLEYAKELASVIDKDLLLITDPLGARTIRMINNAALSLESESKSGFRTKPNLDNFAYEDLLKDALSSSSYDEVIRDKEDRKKLGLPPNKISDKFLSKNIFQLMTLPEYEKASKDDITDNIFKMAFWDVFFETKMLESPFVPHPFYFLSSSKSRFDADKVLSFEKQFHVCFGSLQKMKNKLFAEISAFENPSSLQSVLEEFNLVAPGTEVQPVTPQPPVSPPPVEQEVPSPTKRAVYKKNKRAT